MNANQTTKTKHTCDGPHFGRLTAGCPRCEELAAGAPARKQPWRELRNHNEEMERLARKVHYAPGGPHALGVCGPICTFGDW